MRSLVLEYSSPAVVLDGRGPCGKLRAGSLSLHFLIRPYVIFFPVRLVRTIEVEVVTRSRTS